MPSFEKFDHFTSISDVEAEHLANYDGHIDLTSVNDLSDVAAESLGRHAEGGLTLDGLDHSAVV